VHYSIAPLINSWKNIFTYDNNGNAIKGEFFLWMNNFWVSKKSDYQIHYNPFFYTPFLYYNFGADSIYFDGVTVSVTYKLITTDIKDNQLSADTYSLSQNYPNPFNPTTVIQYALTYESNVRITVYNTLGEVVKTFNEGTKQTGSYNVNFNGEGLSSGIYLYNINAVSIDGKQNFQATKKMILIK
ncbi:MAG: T9SS type A sorting domain-containing protein, partial [Ignavibacteria bacterium]|nr:T9SS type A sorting domain-containing protein [Ignavibacteria bacterium]